MFGRLVIIAATLAAAPCAFAQQSQQIPETIHQSQEDPLPPFYISGGLAWSGEAGLELEAGLQTEIGDALVLRFSPANIAFIDGDIPAGFFWDGEGFGRNCREIDSGSIAFEEDCVAEIDTEWRSVVEAQLRLAPGFHMGGGVAYILQGDFTAENGRVAPFASFSWDMGEGAGFELRAGGEYLAVQLRGLW